MCVAVKGSGEGSPPPSSVASFPRAYGATCARLECVAALPKILRLLPPDEILHSKTFGTVRGGGVRGLLGASDRSLVRVEQARSKNIINTDKKQTLKHSEGETRDRGSEWWRERGKEKERAREPRTHAHTSSTRDTRERGGDLLCTN